MALQNPPNLYSGGQGVFDSRPVLMFQANLMAKKKAKEDALEAYYGKSLQDVTPAGMRNKDIVGGWSQQLEEFKNFGMNPENKKYLLNPSLDGHKTVTEFNRRHTKLLSDAERSKQELKDENMLNEQRVSGKWNPDDDDMVLIDRKGKSIYDPSRYDELGRDVDLTNISFNTPEFDTVRQAKADKLIFGNIKGGKTYDEKNAIKDKATGRIFVPFVESYSTESIDRIGDNAERAVASDKSMRKAYNDLLHNDPDLVEKATGFLQGVEGKNAVIDTPAKLAKADYMMKAASYAKRGEEMKTDWIQQVDKKYGNQVAFEGIRQKNRIELLSQGLSLREAFKDADEAETSADLDQLFKNKIEKSNPSNAFNNQDGAVVDLPMSPVELKVFKKTIPVYKSDGTIKKDNSGKDVTEIVEPEAVAYDKKSGNFRLVGKGYGEIITLPEMKTSYLNNIYSSKSKQSQLPQSSEPIKTKSSSSGSKSMKVTIRPNLPKKWDQFKRK